jgi:LEA14-like dessication related protein
MIRRSGLLALLVASSLTACAGIQLLVERPRVHVAGAELTAIGLESADLLFRLDVENPNGQALSLDGIGYHLRVEGEPLLDGSRDERLEIAGRGATRVELAVTLRYADLVRVLRRLGRDRPQRPGYDLEADLRFAVPVLGEVTVPVRQHGEIPLGRLLGRLGSG